MLRFSSVAIVAFVISCSFPASLLGASYAVVNVSLTADFPGDGQQQILITNETGVNGCTVDYQVCDNVALLNWTLTVAYTSSYYNGTGTVLPNPFVVAWSSASDNIVPANTLNFDLDLCNGAAVASCTTATTSISSITFSGDLSQSQLTVFDPTANGGTGGAGPSATVDPHFSLTLVPGNAFPAATFDFVAKDGLVSDVNVNVLPEPGTTLLLLGGLLTALAVRRR
jgi:hypothetical protein